MATTRAKAAGTEDIDGGIIRQGGTIASSRWTRKLLGDNSTNKIPTLNFSGRTDVIKPYSAGTFAYMGASKFLILGYSTTISGVANTALKFPSADKGNRPSFNASNRGRQTFLSAMTWTANRDGHPTVSYTVTHSETAFAADALLSQSSATPGEFQYMDGGKNPELDDYPARKQW